MFTILATARWCRIARADRSHGVSPMGARHDTAPHDYFRNALSRLSTGVVGVETGGFNSQTDALLEIAAVLIEMRSDGSLTRGETHRYHVIPFPGANMEPASMAVTGIDPHHPLRPAIPEEDALQRIFREIRTAIRAADCSRAVLV